MVKPHPAIIRGEVWLTKLDPTVGSEIQKTRPCVVISPPHINNFLKTVTMAPLTTKSHPAPFRIYTDFHDKEGFILLDQIRTIDRERLLRKLGSLEKEQLSEVLRNLRLFFTD